MTEGRGSQGWGGRQPGLLDGLGAPWSRGWGLGDWRGGPWGSDLAGALRARQLQGAVSGWVLPWGAGPPPAAWSLRLRDSQSLACSLALGKWLGQRLIGSADLVRLFTESF